VGSLVIPKNIVIGSFYYADSNGSPNFYQVTWVEGLGWGWFFSNLFGHVKAALELLMFVETSPVLTFEDHWLYTIIHGKIQLGSVIFV